MQYCPSSKRSRTSSGAQRLQQYERSRVLYHVIILQSSNDFTGVSPTLRIVSKDNRAFEEGMQSSTNDSIVRCGAAAAAQPVPNIPLPWKDFPASCSGGVQQVL
jgi:hypothetical protein